MYSSSILATIMVLAAEVAAIPSARGGLTGYSQAKHVLPLYRTADATSGSFEADITIGSQTVRAIMDTGSSDPFFMPQDVQCLNITTNQPISSDLCGFKGPKLALNPYFRLIPNVHSNLTFGTGESAIAFNGYTNISFGGIVVPQQEIELAKTASITYPGNASGIVGLAYPLLTTVYPGDDPSTDIICNTSIGVNDISCNRQSISPLLSTIFSSSLAPPIFSFAIGRGAPAAGVMTIGGVPNIHDAQVNVTNKATRVTVPIEKLEGHQGYFYYTTSVDGFRYSGAPAGEGNGQYIVDTGTVPITIGPKDAKAFGVLFNPPAQKQGATWYVYCNSTAPNLGVTIGGQTFNINPKDLILDMGQTDPPGICFSGVQEGTTAGDFPPVLGSVFLRNVLAVFDVGQTQMTFVAREHYKA
ncbi:hypothetical protein H2200_011285 [Cladophialophora chaetospira]|uniref:Peptidase A1 domain-containing protein n=1 Tax=Cladophialophora chaetospira TaxID=386627 RepID=A0AA38X0C2_9EURO|nr:hypothetical protein H2200_011285 [Cladophialophora chaetospira]